MTTNTLESNKPFTIIYYEEDSLELKHDHINFPSKDKTQRVILSTEYKKNKTILAVCDGHITFLNKLGDRVFSDARLVS